MWKGCIVPHPKYHLPPVIETARIALMRYSCPAPQADILAQDSNLGTEGVGAASNCTLDELIDSN